MTEQSLGWHRVLNWRPTSVFARIAIVLLLLAPIAIAGTMMWAMWDPSKYLRDIELAVVNEDAGVESRGEYINYGDQIVEGLLNTDYLNFTDVDAEEAQQGLTRGKYMMVVTLPEVFSEQAVTIISENPVRPEIEFATNDYYGTNSSVITAGLIPKVQTSVENAITKKYADKVISGVVKLSTGLENAAEGAGKLDEGAGKLQEGGGKAAEGAVKLDEGAAKLAAGTGKLQAGVGELSQGATKLDQGANQLAGGMDTLVAGTDKLADGAGQINAGVVQLTDKLIPLLTQAEAAAPQLAQAEQVLRAAGMVEQANKVGDLATKLTPGSDENMVAQLNKLRDGTALLHYNLADPNAQYRGGMVKLQDGAHRLADGTGKLTTGVARLSDGSGQLASGANQLKEGTGKFKDGGGELKAGLDKLKDGTDQLSTKLSEGAANAPKIAKPDISAQNMAVPINFTSTNPHPVQTILSAEDPTKKEVSGGVSMLLVMVFGFLIMLILALLLPVYFRRRNHGTTAVLGAWALKTAANAVVLGVLAALSHSMGWQPASWATVLPVLALTAACGAACYQLFQVLFGRGAGGGFGLGFYALGIMVFGGVWPVVAIPAFLRLFHFIHPMTYAKTAFIRATDGIHDVSYWAPVGALLAFTLIALAISVAVLHARRAMLEQSLSATASPAGPMAVPASS
ncbi:YhgE/Pip domain-containing protein [Corynebacterium phocae]|nr:YhgE/Pip domain-containing protein [Corynebacterium phocae]KAA8721102.1 YhgE/Pip domain-containing protein [Corynebacterium phocae]